ncbi:DUF6265 family protein [uncultured Croceitalea sp.]|uniref:DUF6265 family protein n=1 Tax=uncultured Croceitalea sp. TaxID=1798908 RepID=UPI00374E8E50
MRILFFLVVINFTFITAQNTLQLEEEQKSPNANIELVAFMEGHWKGEAFGGITEEIWSPEAGGSMMFVFRHMIDNKVNFYEIGHIRELNSSLIFELKHFDNDLHGWEDKKEVQQFKFIKAEGNRVYFDGFTFENVSQNEINIYGLIGNDDSTKSEIVFNYKK